MIKSVLMYMTFLEVAKKMYSLSPLRLLRAFAHQTFRNPTGVTDLAYHALHFRDSRSALDFVDVLELFL